MDASHGSLASKFTRHRAPNQNWRAKSWHPWQIFQLREVKVNWQVGEASFQICGLFGQAWSKIWLQWGQKKREFAGRLTAQTEHIEDFLLHKVVAVRSQVHLVEFAARARTLVRLSRRRRRLEDSDVYALGVAQAGIFQGSHGLVDFAFTLRTSQRDGQRNDSARSFQVGRSVSVPLSLVDLPSPFLWWFGG